MKRSLIGIVLYLFLFSPVFSAEVVWDRTLEKPPQMSERDIVLAEAVRKPVLKSEYEREKNESESAPSLEISFSVRRGRDSADSYGATSAYVEIPFGGSGLSLWALTYKDPSFTGNYVGLAKKLGDWQIGLGGGNVHYNEMRHTVVNPWVYYSSEKWEGYAHAEHYSRDSQDPWWYKGYLERKSDSFGFGLYGEKDLGLGPRASVKINDHMKIWASVPMWSQPKAGGMKLLLYFVLTY